MALANKGAAIVVKDSEASAKLMETACGLLGEPGKIAEMEKNIAALAKTDAAASIAEEVYRII